MIFSFRFTKVKFCLEHKLDFQNNFQIQIEAFTCKKSAVYMKALKINFAFEDLSYQDIHFRVNHQKV